MWNTNLIVEVIQIGISALQLHHLDLGYPIFLPLQHKISIRVLPDLLLMVISVVPSVPC